MGYLKSQLNVLFTFTQVILYNKHSFRLLLENYNDVFFQDHQNTMRHQSPEKTRAEGARHPSGLEKFEPL